MTRTAPFATSSLVLGIALLTSAAVGALVVQQRGEQNLGEMLAKAHVSYDHINLNLLTGTADLHRVDIPSAAGILHIGHIRLTTSPLAFISTAQAGTGNDIKFENITGSFGPYDIDMPNLVISGSDLSQSALEAMFDPQAAGTLAERVSKLNAAAITADELTLTTTFGDKSTETTYSGLKASTIVQAKLPV